MTIMITCSIAKQLVLGTADDTPNVTGLFATSYSHNRQILWLHPDVRLAVPRHGRIIISM